jgi:NAD(P)-dependent dehydrogenase (short-subunit alcohol dehydrogenase family)
MRRISPVLVGALSVALLNALFFALARVAGLFGASVVARAAGAPLTPGPVVVASVVGVVGAALVRHALRLWLVTPGRARGAFLALSAVLLVVSFASPVQGLAGAGIAEVLVLDAMHVTTALAAVFAAEWSARASWTFGLAPYVARTIAPRVALVSGATSGIGAQVALELALRGFRVVGVGRSVEKARALEGRSEGLIVLTGDLGSMTDASRLATEANGLAGPEGFSHVVHCAGTLKPSSKPTAEGIDSNFATSFLGRFALSQGLRVAPGWRLVNVAAAESGSLPSFLRQELREASDVRSGMRAHGQAQLANDLWTASLARRGVAAFGYGPGAVDSEIRRELPATLNAVMKPLFAVDTRTPREAALDIVRLLLDDALPERGFASRWGLFTHDPFVLDPARQDALVRLSEDLVARATSPRRDA